MLPPHLRSRFAFKDSQLIPSSLDLLFEPPEEPYYDFGREKGWTWASPLNQVWSKLHVAPTDVGPRKENGFLEVVDGLNMTKDCSLELPLGVNQLVGSITSTSSGSQSISELYQIVHSFRADPDWNMGDELENILCTQLGQGFSIPPWECHPSQLPNKFPPEGHLAEESIARWFFFSTTASVVNKFLEKLGSAVRWFGLTDRILLDAIHKSESNIHYDANKNNALYAAIVDAADNIALPIQVVAFWQLTTLDVEDISKVVDIQAQRPTQPLESVTKALCLVRDVSLQTWLSGAPLIGIWNFRDLVCVKREQASGPAEDRIDLIFSPQILGRMFEDHKLHPSLEKFALERHPGFSVKRTFNALGALVGFALHSSQHMTRFAPRERPTLDVDLKEPRAKARDAGNVSRGNGGGAGAVWNPTERKRKSRGIALSNERSKRSKRSKRGHDIHETSYTSPAAATYSESATLHGFGLSLHREKLGLHDFTSPDAAKNSTSTHLPDIPSSTHPFGSPNSSLGNAEKVVLSISRSALGSGTFAEIFPAKIRGRDPEQAMVVKYPRLHKESPNDWRSLASADEIILNLSKEIRAYAFLVGLQGTVIPRFYGTASIRKRERDFPLLALEHTGISLDLFLPSLTQEDKEEIHAQLRKIHQLGWIHDDVARRNITVAVDADGLRHFRFIDLSSVRKWTDPGELDKEMKRLRDCLDAEHDDD